MDPIALDVEAGDIYWWCRCGRSVRQPFCDGAHKGSTLSPLKFIAPESGRVRFCVCKKTASPPFCDGSHARAADPPAPTEEI